MLFQKRARHLLFCIMIGLMPIETHAVEVPLRVDSGIYTVPVQINRSITLQFLIDTGATAVALPEKVVQQLISNGTVTKDDLIGTGTALLADQSSYRTAGFRLRELRIGNVVVSDVIAIVSPGIGMPLLGQNFLNRFALVTFDNQRQVLILSEPRENAAAQTSISASPPSSPALAAAYGSLAFDISSGRSYGSSSNQPHWQSADQAALQSCASRSCQIVLRMGTRECGAVASGDYGTVWGSAKGTAQDSTILTAIQNCQAQGGRQCRIRVAECNG